MKTIPLTQGQVALVDDADYEFVKIHKWFAIWKPNSKTFYARNNQIGYMHRFIMDAKDGQQVDHEDHNGINNQRFNMKLVSNRQNAENRKNQSAYGPGIRFFANNPNKPFLVQLYFKGQTVHLGYFSSIEEAKATRNQWLKEHERTTHSQPGLSERVEISH